MLSLIIQVIKAVLRIRIQGKKYQPKTANKNRLLFKPKSELLKKKILKYLLILKSSLCLSIKQEKIKNSNFFKISLSLRNVHYVHDLDPSLDP